MIALENRTQKSNAQLIRQENLEEIFELAEISGDSDIAQLKALKKINDEKEFQQKLQEFLLEKDINILSEVKTNKRSKYPSFLRTNKIFGAWEKKKKSKKIRTKLKL